MKSNFSSTKQQAANAPHETDPLISTVSSTNQGRRQQEQTIRSRRSSKSPTISQYNNNHRSINNSPTTMQPQDAFLQLQQHEAPHEEARISQPYHVFDTDDNHNNYQDPSRRVASARSNISQGSASSQASRRSYVRRNRAATGAGGGDESQLEIPQEVYSVRKAALSVLKPLTKTWVSVRFDTLRVYFNYFMYFHTNYFLASHISLTFVFHFFNLRSSLFYISICMYILIRNLRFSS